MLAFLDASGNQEEFSDHFYCSLMSSTLAPFSLAVCIMRAWASFSLWRLSCRNFNSCLSTSEAHTGRPSRSRRQSHGRCLYRPYLNKSGTLALPCSSGPSLFWPHTSYRHSSRRGCSSPGTHGRSQGT